MARRLHGAALCMDGQGPWWDHVVIAGFWRTVKETVAGCDTVDVRTTRSSHVTHHH